jgi:DNA invertase Pin-like site-specific DNA recombinase
MKPDWNRCAAAYARMSTDHQTLSISQQLDAIRAYAEAHGLQIVRTYLDEGKSGLSLAGRHGLRNMIADILSGAANYSTVLVLDVSRWGRFQDADESAHYEFICKQAGVKIVYCAEPFSGDGPLTVLVKGIKRAMAAEYSRELSTKVFSAQCKLFTKGFKQGGNPGYGFRRMGYTADGRERGILLSGERKSHQTDRVKLVLGPEEELAIVREIYKHYLDDSLGDTEIAARLNQRGIRNELGGLWRPTDVKSVLTNSKYCGQLVFARTAKKLAGPAVHNASEDWIRGVPSYPPIVTKGIFDAAIQERHRRKIPPTNDELLAGIRQLHDKHGYVNARLLDRELPRMGWRGLEKRFGSMAEAYILAGLPRTDSIAAALTKRLVHRKVASLLDQVKACIVAAGGSFTQIGRRPVLVLHNGAKVRITIACCTHQASDYPRWRVALRTGIPVDFVLVGRLDKRNDRIKDYFLLTADGYNTAHVNLSRRTLPCSITDAQRETVASFFLTR